MKIKVRLLAALLAGLTAVLSLIPVLALNDAAPCTTPIVLISGDSVPITDQNGNMAFSTSDVGEMVSRLLQEGESTGDAVLRILGGILKTYYTGCITQCFDPYYQEIYDAILPIMDAARLDGNGEPTNGSTLKQYFLDSNERTMNRFVSQKDTNSYWFFYDWRLDPYESAEKLNEYITGVKKTTGAEKVGVICRCLGANVLLAYVDRYGMDDICGVGFDGVVVNGSEMLSEPVSGKFVMDPRAISRFLKDLDAVGKAEIGEDIIGAVDDAADSGLFGLVKFIIKFPNYFRIRKGITSSVSLASFYTWPNYWAAVSAEDYPKAIEIVFGKPGSELREQYAGLIEKLDYYDVHVRQRIPELLQQINDNANFAIISKYGFQLAPIAESRNKIGDQFISVEKSSFGATASDVFAPLPDSYVEERTAQGFGKYISPDHQIDASTCLFPDQTFFVKGASHSDWMMGEMALLVKVIEADRQLTVDDLPESHFMVYNYEANTMTQMTEENCHTEAWKAEKANILPRPAAFFRLISFVVDLLKK